MYADLSIWDYFIEHLRLLLIYRFMDESEWSVLASLHDHSSVLTHTIEKVQEKQQQSERVWSQHQPNSRIYLWAWCQYFNYY